MTRLKPIWNDQNITLGSKVRLMRTLIISILLYACETWTLTIELQRMIKAVEMRCYRRLLHISYNVTRSSGLCKKVLQGTVPGKRKRGRQKKRWEDNLKERTGLNFNNSQRAAEDRQNWKKIVADVSSGAPTTLRVPVSWFEFTDGLSLK